LERPERLLPMLLNLLVILATSLPLYAQAEPLIPDQLEHLGFMSGQIAHVFGPKAKLLYFREDRFRKRLHISASISSPQLRLNLLNNGAYLTKQQMEWDGFIMQVESPPEHYRLVFHTPGNGRGSATGYSDDVSSLSFFLPPGRKPLAHKGTGLNSYDPRWQAVYIDMLLLLRGQEPRNFKLDGAELNDLVASQLAEHRGRVEALVQALSQVDRDSPEFAGIQFSLTKEKSELEIMAAFQRGLHARVNKVAPPEYQMRLLKAVANRDYCNGMFEAARGLREAIIAEIAEEVFPIVNNIWNTELEVVPIDYVMALPVKMHSIAYHQDLTAGVLGREPEIRAGTSLTEKPLFWTPQGLFYSALPGGEQYDVNGRNIDLELMNFNVPGLESYFRWETRIQTLDRLCIEATDQFLAGDSQAVDRLIKKIKSDIDHQALAKWAQANHPPKNCPLLKTNRARDPFVQSRKALQKAQQDRKPLTADAKVKLRRWLVTLQKQLRGDQVSALVPLLMEYAPGEVEFLWTHILEQAFPKNSPVANAGKSKKPEETLLDWRVLMQIASQMAFSHGAHEVRWQDKFIFARGIALSSIRIFSRLYGDLGAESFRRRMSQSAATLNQFFVGQPRHIQVSQLIWRLGWLLIETYESASLDPPAAAVIHAPYTISEGASEEVRDSLKTITEAGLATPLIETVEHLIGIAFPDAFVQALFPEASVATILEQRRIRQHQAKHGETAFLPCYLNISGVIESN